MAEHRKEARSRQSSGTAQEAAISTIIVVRVVPRSARIAINREGPETFKVRLTAPPVEGAANIQLRKVLSEKLSLPLRNILFISGETGRVKRLRIEGLTAEDITKRLMPS